MASGEEAAEVPMEGHWQRKNGRRAAKAAARREAEAEDDVLIAKAIAMEKAATQARGLPDEEEDGVDEEDADFGNPDFEETATTREGLEAQEARAEEKARVEEEARAEEEEEAKARAKGLHAGVISSHLAHPVFCSPKLQAPERMGKHQQ